MKSIVRLIVAATLVASIGRVAAADIVVAQIVPLSGPVGTPGGMFAAGASLYFDHVNQMGGLRGEHIRHLLIDDKYDVNTTRAKLRELLDGQSQPAVLMTFGTSSTLAVAADLKARGISLPVFPTGSGSTSLRRPFDKNLFHVRASYSTEYARLIEGMALTGVRRFSIVYQDDAFGKDGLDAVQKMLATLHLHPALVFKHNREQQDISNLVPEVAATNCEVVLLATTANASASFVKQARAVKLSSRIAANSDLDPGDLIGSVGADAAKGVMLSQSLPSPVSQHIAMVADFNHLVDAAGGKLPRNALTLEGYIQARVIVEGLRRSSSLTPNALISSFEGFRSFDLGGYSISYSPQSHEGPTFVDTVIIGAGGRVIR